MNRPVVSRQYASRAPKIVQQKRADKRARVVTWAAVEYPAHSPTSPEESDGDGMLQNCFLGSEGEPSFPLAPIGARESRQRPLIDSISRSMGRQGVCAAPFVVASTPRLLFMRWRGLRAAGAEAPRTHRCS